MPTWVRVRDPITGHQYDLHERDLRVREGRVEVVADYPANTGLTARPRPAKHRVSKSGRPVRKRAEQLPAEETEEISHGGTA